MTDLTLKSKLDLKTAIVSKQILLFFTKNKWVNSNSIDSVKGGRKIGSCFFIIYMKNFCCITLYGNNSELFSQ